MEWQCGYNYCLGVLFLFFGGERGESVFWLINLFLKFLPMRPAQVFSHHTTEWSNHPAASRGLLKPGLDSPSCFPQPKWPGPVARVRGRTAGQQDGRTAGHRHCLRGTGGSQLRCGSHRPRSCAGGAQATSGDRYHLAFILQSGYSQLTTTDSSSAPPRCVQDGRVLSASFLHHPLPRHGWGSPAARGLARKEATNPPPSAFVGNAL